MKSLPLLLAAALAAGACTPSLDWREVRPADSGVLALFPCKPEINSHPATAAEPVRMGLAQCKAGGLSFALSWAEIDDPAQVTPALRQMRESLAGKLAAVPSDPQPLQVPGMTPNPQAQSQRLAGSHQQAQVAVFTRGRLVYQLVMLGEQRNDAAWESFLGTLKLEV